MPNTEINNTRNIAEQMDERVRMETEQAERRARQEQAEQERMAIRETEQTRRDEKQIEEARQNPLTPREIEENRGARQPDDDRSREVRASSGDSMRVSPEADEMAENVSVTSPISLRD